MGNLPGYKYLHATSSPDTVIAKVPAEGVWGALGKKQEFVLRKGSGLGEASAQVLLSLPMWALEKGVYAEVESEIDRWMWGGLLDR